MKATYWTKQTQYDSFFRLNNICLFEKCAAFKFQIVKADFFPSAAEQRSGICFNLCLYAWMKKIQQLIVLGEDKILSFVSFLYIVNYSGRLIK